MFPNDQATFNTDIIIDDSATMPLSLRKKRTFHHQACLLSVMAAFTLGLAMGIFFLPLIGLTSAKPEIDSISNDNNNSLTNNNNKINSTLHKLHKYDFQRLQKEQLNLQNEQQQNLPETINNNNNFMSPTIYSSVSFISDEKYSTENILENILKTNNNRKLNIDNDFMIKSDGLYYQQQEQEKEDDYRINNKNNDFDDIEHDNFELQQSNFPIGKQLKTNKNKTSTNKLNSNIQYGNNNDRDQNQENHRYEKENNETLNKKILQDDIYWGPIVEKSLPQGFTASDAESWVQYMKNTQIVKIEPGCGRMQNRLVTFHDGVKACVRYRQNTDQIQGELFSFYLGQLLNITNLAPSTAILIDTEDKLWHREQVKQQIADSQWKTSRPVVFTKWLPDLEPSGIPDQFQPLERHLNKGDIWNITMNDGSASPNIILIDRLRPKQQKVSKNNYQKVLRRKQIVLDERIMNRFVELAQWSDLIVFDYLIANLDRVVNNLYNFQWNADIMAAPAHNLARQSDTQLLVFLDNESGLLHGYRLLKKYEAYHGLLLDNLCIFRKSTIDALRRLRDNDPGFKIHEYFENTTSSKLRDVLPPLPEKSVKILLDRIDRVLDQVQKCQDFYR
jgi:four-jointed box protein 1